MKTRKNLMLLVLLSLFVSVGVADSKVVEVNASEAKDDPWGLDEMDEAMEEALALEKASIEAEKASIEAEKASIEAEKASIEVRDATISAILRK